MYFLIANGMVADKLNFMATSSVSEAPVVTFPNQKSQIYLVAETIISPTVMIDSNNWEGAAARE